MRRTSRLLGVLHSGRGSHIARAEKKVPQAVELASSAYRSDRLGASR
jgi:hypothetical protein